VKPGRNARSIQSPRTILRPGSKRGAAAFALAIAGIPAHAGRPLTTEDVATLEDKACQVEAWVDRSRVDTRAWAVPACNFGWGIEWQAGFARAHENNGSAFSESYVQGKKVIVPPAEGRVGFGVVAGFARIVRRDTHRGWEDPYAILPVTWTPKQATAMHHNIGWTRDKHSASDSTLWGIAGEQAISPRWTLVAEAFGTDRDRPYGRLGARMSAAKGLDFDFTVVARSGGPSADRYLSIGLTWATSPFLP
jgi:hypothetical protein